MRPKPPWSRTATTSCGSATRTSSAASVGATSSSTASRAFAEDGLAFGRSVFGTTPMGDVVPVEGGLDEGLPDVVAFPDLSTIKPIPWEPGVAHCIADIYNPDGTPSQVSPRNVLKRVVERFASIDMSPHRRARAGVLRPRARRARAT